MPAKIPGSKLKTARVAGKRTKNGAPVTVAPHSVDYPAPTPSPPPQVPPNTPVNPRR